MNIQCVNTKKKEKRKEKPRPNTGLYPRTPNEISGGLRDRSDPSAFTTVQKNLIIVLYLENAAPQTFRSGQMCFFELFWVIVTIPK